MKTIRVVAAVIKAVNKTGESIIFANLLAVESSTDHDSKAPGMYVSTTSHPTPRYNLFSLFD